MSEYQPMESAPGYLRPLQKGFASALLAALTLITACHQSRPNPNTVTMLIESSPTNLDPRVGTDAQSEHIDSLIFDSLVRKDARFNVQPWLASSWETPNPLTYIFHLRQGVRFHNSQPLTATDVKWTLDSVRTGAIPTVKAQAYKSIDSIECPGPQTVVLHLKNPDYSLLWNLADGAIGILPANSPRTAGQHPIGSGPFRFVSQEQDKEVLLERNPDYWNQPAQIEGVRFAVVPDAITRALELQKGAADAAINALTADMLYALRDNPILTTETTPGTVLNYIGFNIRDPLLKDPRVRQAIACAIDRPLITETLWRGHAHLAESILPAAHWAYATGNRTQIYDPARANALLDAAGFHRRKDGVRFHLTIKTSTDETSRTLAVIIQQQLRQVGIALDVRSFEFATFYADIAKGAFQLYTLRWIGGNEDPDIFRYAYATASIPPHGANRGYYSNSEVDSLLAAAIDTPAQSDRAAIYAHIQQVLATDLPSINLWYLDTVLIHNRRLHNVQPSASGTYDFLRNATLSN